MEANKVAFVSTVHVGDDPNGEGFGVAHYVTKRDKRLRSERGDDCAYGPRESCTIDTNRKFTAIFSFSSAGAQFGYSLVLEQDGGQRRATLGAQLVRYMGKPGKGNVGSADEANVVLTKALASGMTLVVSHCEYIAAGVHSVAPISKRRTDLTVTLFAPSTRPHPTQGLARSQMRWRGWISRALQRSRMHGVAATSGMSMSDGHGRVRRPCAAHRWHLLAARRSRSPRSRCTLGCLTR